MNWAVFLFFVALILGSLFYFGHAKEDCDAKNGVLVTKTTGGYACVSKQVVK